MATKIYVVDADPTVQRAVGTSLTQAGYEVAAFDDGAGALRQWRADRPGLIMLAATIPGADGFAVLARLREEEAGRIHTPVIMLLGDGQADLRVKALRSGADDYLLKPFHPAELLARMRSLLARYGVPAAGSPAAAAAVARKEPARVVVFYGAKGGVGTTTIAINAAIALRRELQKKVLLIDANLQFGDHRVFLDLGLDRKSIIDLATTPNFDAELTRQILVEHESGVKLLLAPPSPETSELVKHDDMPAILKQMADDFDYIVLDVDKRLDEVNLQVMDAAHLLYVVLTADLPCLKNVRLVLETISHLGYEEDKIKLVLNRCNAFTGINVKNAESALKRRIDYQIVNEYRASIGALNSGAPFMLTKSDSVLGRSVLDFAKGIEKDAGERAAVAAKAAAR